VEEKMLNGIRYWVNGPLNTVLKNTNKLKEFVSKYTIKMMIYSYADALKKFGNERQVRKAVREKKVFVIARGYYGDEYSFDYSYVGKRYPLAVLTGRSAFYRYGLTDTPPDLLEVATPLGSTRIPDHRIKQSFQIASLFNKGIIIENGDRMYDFNRMLIELFRLKKSYPYDYFKEVLDSYRSRSSEIDFVKVARYLKDITYGERILREIREAF
jgi:hypothetical protein